MQLTRRHIVATAMKMIESDGAADLSMDRLATELGCGLLPLYRRIPSRSALLDAVAEAVVAQAVQPSVPEPADPTPAGWPHQLKAQAREFWQAARTQPRSALVAVSRPPATAGMVRPVEQALATLAAAGFGGQDSIRIIRAVRAYVAGSILCEVGVAPGMTTSDARPHLPASEFPEVTRMASLLAARDAEADFEFGLDLLLQAVCHRR